MHVKKRRQRVAVAASAITAFGIAVALPGQATADQTRTASAAVDNHTLFVRGTNSSDNIEVGVGSNPGTLEVAFGQNSAPLVFDRADFSSIAVLLGAGDDHFTVATRGGDITEPMFVDGGNGDDTITGGAGNDIIAGGNGDDTIHGGAGSDVIFGGSGNDTVDGGRGTDTEILGRGDDVAAWDPGEGNDAISGGRGHDTLVFNGSNGNEKFDVSANGTRALLTRDVGTIRMDLSGVEGLNLATLGGSDQVTLHDLRGTGLTQADIDLSLAGTGDDQSDTVVVDGTDGPDHVDVSGDGGAVNVSGLAVSTRVTGTEGFDTLQVNTGDGNDSVHVDDSVAKLIGVTVDLGSGQIL